MEDYIICKPVMLPMNKFGTDEGQIIKAINFNLLNIDDGIDLRDKDKHWWPQHLYLVSDEEIKEGDWAYSLAVNKLIHIRSNDLSGMFHKVEATTDKSLGLPAIPQSFIEKYIEKQGKINQVRVRVDFDGVLICDFTGKDKAEDREVIILSIKDSWNREEVMEAAWDAYVMGMTKATGIIPDYVEPEQFDEWFDKNY